MFTRRVFYYFVLVLISFLFIFSQTNIVLAGFGITPPYVKNDRLTRDSSFQQKITLVRADPIDDLKAEITLNVPGINEWFSIDKGKEFILAKGAKQVPIIITVNVPKDAKYDDYEGSIRIRTSPIETSEGGGVSIALGAQIDVDISVVDKVYDFNIRKVKMADLEEGHKKWGLFFPGRIRFFMTTENTGNIEFGPTKVRLDIYDSKEENLLETIENRGKIKRIEPFAIEEIIANFATRLKAGRYTAKYTIFNNDKIAQQGDINLSISALGSISGYKGYGFMALSFGDKAKVIGVIVGMIALLYVLARVVKMRSKRKIAGIYEN